MAGKVDDKRVGAIIQRAMAKAGSGWDLLGPSLQAALIDAETVNVIAANEDNEGYGKAAALIDAVREAAAGT